MKVLFFLRRIGPYHHARFQEAAKVMDLITVETRASSEEYAWKFSAKGSYTTEQFELSSDPEIGLRGDPLKRSIVALIDKHCPNVIVNTGWADPEYNQIVVEASARKIPLVVISDSRPEISKRRFYVEQMKRIMLRAYSSALVAGAESTEYITWLGFDRKAVFKPWDVVDNDVFMSAGRATRSAYQDRKFICVSRFLEYKNLNRLIEAYSIYIRDGGQRKLVLSGGGKLKNSLEDQIRSHKLTGLVELHDFVQQDAVFEMLRQGIALILPSTGEPWGLVVNEAMAYGLPVAVSSGCGCAVDLVKDGRNGVIFDPYDVGSIAQSLKKIDGMTEQQWDTMSRESQLEIKKWGLPEFSNGLNQACSYAIANPPRGAFKLLHKLLARK